MGGKWQGHRACRVTRLETHNNHFLLLPTENQTTVESGMAASDLAERFCWSLYCFIHLSHKFNQIWQWIESTRDIRRGKQMFSIHNPFLIKRKTFLWFSIACLYKNRQVLLDFKLLDYSILLQFQQYYRGTRSKGHILFKDFIYIPTATSYVIL